MALVLLILIVGMSIGYTLRIYHESTVDAYYMDLPDEEMRLLNAEREQDNNFALKVKLTPKYAKRFNREK